jgi:hypothetical protein
LEFIRKLLKMDRGPEKTLPDLARGSAPMQSQEEQDATRTRMESEMADQKERRESHEPKQ